MTRVLMALSDGRVRQRIGSEISGLPGIEIIAAVPDLTAAYHVAEHTRPDLALISLDLAQQPEFEVMGLLFRALRIRCLVVTDGRAGQRASIGSGELETISVNAVAERLGGGARSAAARPAPMLDASHSRMGQVAGSAFHADRVILIGSSTGGVDALIKVLGAFPADCPPTLVVQHTGGSFTAGLARLIDSHVAPHVAEAQHGARIGPGQIRIAPGSDRHLTLSGRSPLSCRLADGAAVSGHRPSVDALFRSAVPIAPQVVAAILTGMGRDGAAGITELRRAGATTFGQDEATSVVYGMPRVAHEMGGVGRQLGVGSIGPALLAACRRVPA